MRMSNISFWIFGPTIYISLRDQSEDVGHEPLRTTLSLVVELCSLRTPWWHKKYALAFERFNIKLYSQDSCPFDKILSDEQSSISQKRDNWSWKSEFCEKWYWGNFDSWNPFMLTDPATTQPNLFFSRIELEKPNFIWPTERIYQNKSKPMSNCMGLYLAKTYQMNYWELNRKYWKQQERERYPKRILSRVNWNVNLELYCWANFGIA